jgi:hypothetical protein
VSEFYLSEASVAEINRRYSNASVRYESIALCLRTILKAEPNLVHSFESLAVNGRIKLILNNYGIVIPQSLFPRQMVEQAADLQELNKLVPESHWSSQIGAHIIKEHEMASDLNYPSRHVVWPKLDKSFMTGFGKNPLDIPAETAFSGSW